jgi:hypothetical protein
MRTLILTLIVLIAVPSVALAKKKKPGDLPKPHALKKGVDPQNPKVKKFKLFHKH